MDNFIHANWPAPKGIHAGVTLRSGGVSQPPYDSFNLGAHMADTSQNVAANRAQLKKRLRLPSSPYWLEQVHRNKVTYVGQNRQADASFADRDGQVCVVMTADCLPVLFVDRQARCWAAAHAGWRGLSAGILENTIQTLPASPDQLLAWLGPAIGPQAFEVGGDVVGSFCSQYSEDKRFFRATAQQDKYLADIYGLARARLKRLGVSAVYGGQFCTYYDSKRFYSYRRDGETGRMASLVWRENQNLAL